MNIRTSGILMHPSSLPGRCGIGDLGPEAYRFVDFLSASGQHIWQILPLNPVEPQNDWSPYHSASAFAGNPMLINPWFLVQVGLLSREETAPARPLPEEFVDYPAAAEHKSNLLCRVFDRFESRGNPSSDFERFCSEEKDWLDDYATYMALKEHFQMRGWNQWPRPLRDREPEALASFRDRFAMQIRKHRFVQFLFFQQWRALKKYCNARSIRIYGDLPIYMPLDSADVWGRPQQYKLDENRASTAVSGVPPDYFSATGQLWGHPVYDWDYLRQNDYNWWMMRFQHNFNLFDVVRIDHFRGLVAFWEVAASARTAIAGRWVEAPADDFFSRLAARFGRLPVIAEDLGIITPDVRECMHNFQLPGMRVLQFAFGDDFPQSSFLPHRHVRDCIVYTGTHDNNTTRGWFDHEIDDRVKDNLRRYLGQNIPAEEIHRVMIRLAMMSVADTVIIPLQDLIGLGADARMNQPAVAQNNWRWRLPPGRLTGRHAEWLLETTVAYGRHRPNP